MATTISQLTELQRSLRSSTQEPLQQKVFVGFDGFIDKIKRAVKEKQNTKTIYFDSIQEFADRVLLAAGKSGQIQMDTKRIKFGGNGPILASTLGNLGVGSFCVGTMGYPRRLDIFSGMSKLCEPISVLNPGLSDAVEFSDGKLIFSELEVFDHYTWEHVRKVAGIEHMTKAVLESSLIMFVDWANLPHASNIWEGVLDDIVKPSKRKDFRFFFDLCDPSKKTTQQIDEVLDVIGCFSAYGKVTLGLNENETLKIWSALKGVDFMKEKEKIPPVEEAGEFLYRSMNIDSLLVHPIDRSIGYHQHEIFELKGRLVTEPKVLTGGGDNLNAGFGLGLLLGFSMPDCMLLGMAASGAYIENGSSPDLQNIFEYLDVWIHDLEQKNTESVKHVFTHRHQ
jgi:hypothetical protein